MPRCPPRPVRMLAEAQRQSGRIVTLASLHILNHFSHLFSRKVSTGFMCASFLVSSFLMWSYLFFLLAHFIILISIELSLFSSIFFMVQHSEPYVIAGLMIVLKTLSFNSTGIFQSHIAPGTSFHFIHPILIKLLTSASEPSSLVNRPICSL